MDLSSFSPTKWADLSFSSPCLALPLEHKQHPLLPGAALPPTQGLEHLLAAQILCLPLSSIPAMYWPDPLYLPLFLNPLTPIWRKVILTNQIQRKHG